MGGRVLGCIQLKLEGSPERGGDSLSLQLCAQSAGDKLPFCPKVSTKAWLDRLPIHPFKPLPLARSIRVHDDDPILAKARGDRRAFAGAQVLEVQVAHQARRMDDGHYDPRVLGCGIQLRQARAACAGGTGAAAAAPRIIISPAM